MLITRLPLKGEPTAPKFEGGARELLPYLAHISAITHALQLAPGARITAALRYTSADVRDLWKYGPAALKGDNYRKFLDEILDMYPEVDTCYPTAVDDILAAEDENLPAITATSHTAPSGDAHPIEVANMPAVHCTAPPTPPLSIDPTTLTASAHGAEAIEGTSRADLLTLQYEQQRDSSDSNVIMTLDESTTLQGNQHPTPPISTLPTPTITSDSPDSTSITDTVPVASSLNTLQCTEDFAASGHNDTTTALYREAEPGRTLGAHIQAVGNTPDLGRKDLDTTSEIGYADSLTSQGTSTGNSEDSSISHCSESPDPVGTQALISEHSSVGIGDTSRVGTPNIQLKMHRQQIVRKRRGRRNPQRRRRLHHANRVGPLYTFTRPTCDYTQLSRKRIHQPSRRRKKKIPRGYTPDVRT